MKQLSDKYEAVIGLEIHAQLLTETKAFCGCSAKYGAPPNTNICPICLGHPGVLPVLNKKAVAFAVKMGLATNSKINERSQIARKNYFYPDLPKGYQISQYEEPICENGYIEIKSGDTGYKIIRIKRIHLEEDAGKSIHDRGNRTLVDLNRCGVPLLEIVSEPDMNSPAEAYEYLSRLKLVLLYLEICDGNMEEGSLRCDANISIRLKGEKSYGTKTELKNMNSFRNVERALQFEINRQIEIVEEGGAVLQETLLWDDRENAAKPMRGKEEAHDYRYFPEPDLMPIGIDKLWKDKIRVSLPELPQSRKNRFMSEYNLPEYDSDILTSDKKLADYFEEILESTKDHKSASNWVMVDILKIINDEKIPPDKLKIKPSQLGQLINFIKDGTISSKIAKEVFAVMAETGIDPLRIIEERNLIQIADPSFIKEVIENILSKNRKQVEEYLSGKEKVFGFLVGQIMKETKGKANPKTLNELLKQRLDDLKE